MEKLEEREEDQMNVPVVEGELIADESEAADEEQTLVSARPPNPQSPDQTKNQKPKTRNPKPETQSEIADRRSQTADQKTYLLLPFLFLTVTLLGGLRFSSDNNAFIFWRPALFCLIAAAILLVLFARAGLVRVEGWFSEDFPALKNVASGAVIVSLFAASVQVFNSLLPERGLPFWVFAFCFFWTLWNNLFADFDTRKLLRSLGALFGLAFVVKYLILINLAAPAAESWWQGIWQNPGKEAVTWLLDLPRFAASTGYIQFFTIVFYLIGLYLLPQNAGEK